MLQRVAGLKKQRQKDGPVLEGNVRGHGVHEEGEMGSAAGASVRSPSLLSSFRFLFASGDDDACG